MSEALRSLLAEFVVQVDKAGELARGNEAVTALKERLVELQAEFAKVKAPAARAGKAVQDAFLGGGFGATPGLAAGIASASRDRLQGLFGGFGAGSGSQDSAGPVGPDRQFGPTRETLNAGRAAMRASEQAAADYAKTLKGKLAAAVKAVRAGFNGGGGSEGPGLLASLATVRNGLLALGAGAVVHGVTRVVDSIGDIGEAAQRLGVTTDDFQRLNLLARQNGTSVEALGSAFRQLANVAVQPTKESTAAMAELGVSTKDSKGQFKSANDLFFDTAEALSGVGNELKRSALAQDVFGRGAIELKPILANGTEAIRQQRKALMGLNLISKDTIDSADRVSDTWKGLGLQFLAATEPLLKLLLPALETLNEYLIKGIDALGKFLKHTDFVGAALTALGVVLAMHVVPWLSLMIGLGGGVTATLLGMAGAAARSALAFAAWAIPAAIIEDFIGFLRGDESAIGEALDMVFGKGANAGVIEALGKAWDLLASAVKRVLEALHLFKPSDTDLAQRNGADQTYEGSNFQRKLFPLLRVAADALIPGLGTGAANAADAITSGTASADSSIPAPGYSAGSEPNQSLAPNVSIGDSTVNITMGPSATAADVGSEVSSSMERNRDAILASYPP